ncbi:MAG: GGDEF domain-containing protein [Sulfuricurvum sp.]|jgi:diguanylate cyclase
MSNTSIYQKVFDIHDQVMGIVRSMKIPPYPAHYKKFFDKLFLEMADAELRKDQQDSEQKVLSGSKDDVTKYIDIAKRSVMSFTEAHADIASVAQEQQEYIENVPSNSLENYLAFTQGLSALNKNLSDELHKAQLKINDLTTDLQEALSSLAIDPLTKVPNRKGFMDDLESAIQAGQDKKLSMVLIMIDVDNFKYINDEHGHLAGDKILYFLAQTVKTMIRTVDQIYRYGGEEFAVVLSRCDETKAFEIADNIRSKIEHSNLLYSGKSVYVTISVGVTIHQQGDTFDNLIGRAEKALFCAKKSNKNCTVHLDC